LNLTSQNIYSTLMCGLRIFAGPAIYHLPGNVISATVGCIYINLQPTSFLVRLVSDISRSLGENKLGAMYSPATPKENFFAQGLSFCSWLRVRFDLTNSINFRDINGFPKLWPKTLIRGHPKGSIVIPLDFTGMISY